MRALSIVRKTSVAFRSAKVAFFHSFAERKATIKDRTMLNEFWILDFGFWIEEMNETREPNSVEADDWRLCDEQLKRIGAYEFDWNDEGAESPGREVLALAQAVIDNLLTNHQPPPHQCFATDEGHVIFVWEDGKSYFEVEVDRLLCCTARRLPPAASHAVSTEFSPHDPPSTWFPNLPLV